MEATVSQAAAVIHGHLPGFMAPCARSPDARGFHPLQRSGCLHRASLGSKSSASRNVFCNASTRTLKRTAEEGDGELMDNEHSRREIMLQSVNLAIFGDAVAGTGTDPTTIINSILGAYGLPKLKAAAGYRLRDEFDEDFVFEYPRSWVARRNTLREGIVVSDFNTPDKAAVEVFPSPQDSSELVTEVVRRAVSPGPEVGGDARLELPPLSKIKTDTEWRGDVKYTYISFPSETVTRSGYQIPRRNWAVAAEHRGRVFALVASGQRDRLGAEQEAALRHIVESFRIR